MTKRILATVWLGACCLGFLGVMSWVFYISGDGWILLTILLGAVLTGFAYDQVQVNGFPWEHRRNASRR